MKFTGIFFSFLTFLFGGYDISRGSELQRASAAYKEGDYETALQTFIQLAENQARSVCAELWSFGLSCIPLPQK